MRSISGRWCKFCARRRQNVTSEGGYHKLLRIFSQWSTCKVQQMRNVAISTTADLSFFSPLVKISRFLHLNQVSKKSTEQWLNNPSLHSLLIYINLCLEVQDILYRLIFFTIKIIIPSIILVLFINIEDAWTKNSIFRKKIKLCTEYPNRFMTSSSVAVIGSKKGIDNAISKMLIFVSKLDCKQNYRII